MCSTPGPRLTPDSRLALISIAIDKLAAEARAGRPGDGPDGMAARLACVWAMMADLDPALAQRLPYYTAAG
jgi:hypothetical protein